MSKKNIIAFSLMVVAVAVVLAVTMTPPAGGKGRIYGKPMDPQSAPMVAIAALFAKTGEYVEKQVTLEGQIGQVCQTSGCWITLTDGTNQLFVQFYDFTVRIKPGTKVKASGQVRVRNRAPYLAAIGLEVQG